MTQHYRHFSAPAAARLVGVTYRQIDHAIRIGVFEPETPASGSGSRRELSLKDVLRLRAARILSEELEITIPQALELVPRDADLEGMVVVHPSQRTTVQVDLSLEPELEHELELTA